MARLSPQSQTRDLMKQKEDIARRLLEQGLTIAQICGQLRCSPTFVKRIRRETALAQ